MLLEAGSKCEWREWKVEEKSRFLAALGMTAVGVCRSRWGVSLTVVLRGGQTGEGGASAVGFLAMTDTMDAQGTGRFFGEADAVVADAETQLGGLPLELFDIALVGLGEAMERFEDAHGGVAVETADIGT